MHHAAAGPQQPPQGILGPRPLPLIGNLLDMGGGDYLSLQAMLVRTEMYRKWLLRSVAASEHLDVASLSASSELINAVNELAAFLDRASLHCDGSSYTTPVKAAHGK